MTVYLPKGGKSYWYDFWWRGERHRDNTHVTTEVQARQVESQKREKLAAGVLGLDLYGMRDALQKAGPSETIAAVKQTAMQ